MKILFVLKNVFPEISATSKIIDNIAINLIENYNCEVTYFALSNSNSRIKQYKSINFEYRDENKSIKLFNNNKKIGRTFNKIIRRLVFPHFVNVIKTKKKLEKLIDANDKVIFAIGTVGNLNYIIKKYGYKSNVWLVDPVSSKHCNINNKKIELLEKKAFETVNKIFIGDYIYDKSLKNKYKYISNKFITTKLPNITNIAEPNIVIEKSNKLNNDGSSMSNVVDIAKNGVETTDVNNDGSSMSNVVDIAKNGVETTDVNNDGSSMFNVVDIAKNSIETTDVNNDELDSKCKTENLNNTALEKPMDSKKIKCVFSGFFYSDIRNPKYFIEFLENLSNKNIEITIIYGWYSEQTEEFKKFVSKTFDNIKFYYRLPMNEALKLIKNANILINIGNTIANQLPSKILDYINACKPIVNFYKIDDCPTLDYMDKYPISLNIKETEKINIADVKKFENFCIHNFNKTLNYDIIKELFYESTVAYVTKIIYDNLNK